MNQEAAQTLRLEQEDARRRVAMREQLAAAATARTELDATSHGG